MLDVAGRLGQQELDLLVAGSTKLGGQPPTTKEDAVWAC
jgi:hypothetical protein